MDAGIRDELRGIDLGDKRLNNRSGNILEALAANPEASVNASHSDWAETQAAYRFFNNENVTPEKILEPHFQASVRRIREQPVVLLAQDTTELDFSDHPAQDLRSLNVESRRGVYMHLELALTPDRLPLGVMSAETYDRDPATLGTRAERKFAPIETKESFRWLQGYRRACELAASCPETQVVSVADAEADIYEVFLEAQQQAEPRADYVIRLCENRSTPERNPEVSAYTYHKIYDELAGAPLLATIEIDLRATPKRKARRATLEIRATTVTIKPPFDRPHLPTLTHNMILAEEINGPEDGTDVCWRLGTTLPIETLAQTQQVIDYYKARWIIETYFRTLKTGCKVEEIQLETKARLLNCLSLYLIIAWRVLHTTHLGRVAPDVSCEAYFADYEWKPIWRIVKKTNLPPKPPKLGEFIKLLAALGGYNNRPSEPPPGPQAIWIGIRRMLDFVEAWLTFGPEARGDVCK